MEHILEKRRVFEKVREQSFELITVRNSFYNPKEAKEFAVRGLHYPIEEYIEKEVPRTIYRERSHIEYRIRCEFCGGTTGWVRRKDAKYCSDGCRKLAWRTGNQENKEML